MKRTSSELPLGLLDAVMDGLRMFGLRFVPLGTWAFACAPGPALEKHYRYEAIEGKYRGIN